MDPTTLLGIILGFALIVNGIGFAKIGNFINIPSMVIVIGGALSATLSSYPLGILKDIPKHFAVLIRGNRYNIPKLIEQLVDLGTIARQSGLLALEDKAAEIKDPFFRQSVLMIVDANDPDKVRLVLERELDNMMVRHDQAAGLYEKAASYAPSFGMIGTLIGLINMLKGMNMDAGGSSTIGSDMSVALITTFYGCILANVIFNPIAKKLRIRQSNKLKADNAIEMQQKEVMIEGLLSIQAGENPKYLREHLLASIKQSQQQKILAKTEGGDSQGKEQEDK